MSFQKSKESFVHFQSQYPYSNRVHASTATANYLVCWNDLSCSACVYPMDYRGYEEIGERAYFPIAGRDMDFQAEEINGSHSFGKIRITLELGWKYFR